MNSFAKQLKRAEEYCNSVLEKYLSEAVSPYASTVAEAMRYSVKAGGKRLRPIFITETCRMYGGDMLLAEPFMAALEMIHTYSLVHDDLPCMDNDEYRRGQLTTHKVYGEGMAVLAGDGLLNFAYETALKAFDVVEHDEMPNLNDFSADAESSEDEIVARYQRIHCALQVLARNAGIHGMVGGQCADLNAEEKADVSAEELLYIHEHKTAYMIESGFVIGAILAGAPEEDIEKLDQIARDIGVAFQIQDDILDVTGDEKQLGKKTGMDAEDHKTTYVTLYGLKESENEVGRLTEEALSLFDSLTVKNDFLRELICSLVGRIK